MNIAVLIKRVPDTASVFKIGTDEKSVDTGGLKFIVGPYDEHALEEAIQLREAGKAEEVVAVTMGMDGAQETIRTALAMGADRALFIKDVDGTSCKGTSEVLAAALKTEEFGLIFAGKQAVDDDASQVPERVAEILEIPHVSVVTKLEVGDGSAVAVREIEGGSHTVEFPLPALCTIEKGINTPRYPTLPNIMKAKKKEIKELSLGDIGLSDDQIASQLVIEGMSLPRQNRLNNILEGEIAECVDQLLNKLRQDEKVL
ncbi:MAG: electron transfer flavoprotein subunit beta/FixA family protein [Candidatus Hydrogenedentota bacterium]